MTGVSRRKFLGTTAGAAAGVAGATALARLGSAGPFAQALKAGDGPGSDEPILAYVRAGKLSIMKGSNTYAVDDPQLVGQLVRAAR